MKGFLLVLSVAFPLLFSPFSFAATPHYAIIVDGGSTGSRLHLFRYQIVQPLPIIKDIFSASTKPGLSAFAHHTSAAGASLKEILDQAAIKLKQEHIDAHTVSISILSTAGMRLLPQKTQQAIYNNIREYLHHHYNFKIAEIKTISGKMEGVYGWLDINYLLKAFNNKSDTTKGSIDMGGASTQIVFSTHSTNYAKESSDELSLQINHHTYTVLSKSFLGLGMIQLLNQIRQNTLAEVCYPADYSYSPSTLGRFNFSACNSLYSRLLNQYPITKQNTLIATNSFIAHSGVYYIFNFFEPGQTKPQVNLVNSIQNICNKKWTEIKTNYSHTSNKELATLCANGVYLTNLLYKNYKLQDSQLQVTNRINHHEIDWTLGALLYQLISV